MSTASFLRNKWSLYLVLFFIFAAGLGIRLFDLTNPPLDFHPARQFHSAILARGFYTRMLPDSTDFIHGRILAQVGSEPWIEPPIMEALTAFTYRLAGGDFLWIPRLYSILFWMLGGVGLYLLAKRLAGEGGAVFSLLFYFLLPYGVIASRSFQPDPLMVCLMVWSLWALTRWAPEADWNKTILTGVLAGIAILVKQVSVFFIGGAMAAIMLYSKDRKKTLRSAKTWVMVGLTFMPAVIYNFWGLFIDGFLRQQYENRLYPELWREIGFYLQWLVKVDDTVGLLTLLIALAGLWLLFECRYCALFYGYFIGYLVYGMVFAHHITTHDYYQIPLIPLVALGIAPVGEYLIRRIHEVQKGKMAAAALVILSLIGIFFFLWRTETRMKRVDFRSEPAIWKSLGEKMGYENSNVIGLFSDYGVRLMYWGYITPVIWPTTADQEFNGTQPGVTEIEERLSGKYYFVVNDLQDFEKQPQLKKFLVENYAIFDQGKGYLIFDLRKPIK